MLKHHNNIKKQTNQGSGRPVTSVFCEVKLTFLSKESGDLEQSDITAVSG